MLLLLRGGFGSPKIQQNLGKESRRVWGRDHAPAPCFRHPRAAFPGTDFSLAAGSSSRTGGGGKFR